MAEKSTCTYAGNVQLSLCLIEHYATAPPFLTLALDGGEWSASHTLPLYPWGKSPQVPIDAYKLERFYGKSTPQDKALQTE
jgi:hypothetical protein